VSERPETVAAGNTPRVTRSIPSAGTAPFRLPGRYHTAPHGTRLPASSPQRRGRALGPQREHFHLPGHAGPEQAAALRRSSRTAARRV